MRVIALDPGKNNFAYALIADGTCETFGQLSTITDLHYRVVSDQLGRFKRDAERLFNRAGPNDWLGFERMQHRPRMGGGGVVEYINLMIGVCLALARDRCMHVYPVSPVTWKNHFIRQLGLDRERFTMATQKLSVKTPPGSKHKTMTQLVEGVLHGRARAANITPHEADAVGIGSYCWERLTGISMIERVLR